MRNKYNYSDDHPSGFDKMLVSELKVELQTRGLSIVGLKPDLRLRLKEAINSEMQEYTDLERTQNLPVLNDVEDEETFLEGQC